MNAFARPIDKYPVILILFVLAALGVAGSMDYADAKLQEKIICARNTAPAWCSEAE